MQIKRLSHAIAITLATATAATHAQSISDTVLEEIVVTAKQRSESLQEVPLSISVFSSDELASLGVEDVRGLADFTPNFNIYSGSGRQDASAINIRGLSANTSDERYQPVSFFVDGIFMGGVTVGLQTVDVQRIEVIKGPQSATFGRATYAGAIDFVTNTPSMEGFSGHVRAQLSSNTEDNTNYIGNAFIQGPLIKDKLSGSLFLNISENGGFDQARGSQFPEVGSEETKALNGVLFAQLTPNTTAKFRTILSKEDDQEAIYHTTQPAYWQQQGSNIVTLPSGALFVQGAVPDPIRDRLRGVDLPVDPVASPGQGGYERERKFASIIIDHEMDNGYNLSYKGAFLQNEYDANVDFRGRSLVGVDPVFGRALPIQTENGATESTFNFRFPFPFQEEFEETSHQFRVTSPDAQFRWSAGAYLYFSTDTNFQQRSDRTAPEGNPARQTRGDENIDNTAIFGSVEYDFNEAWTVGLEGRFQRESVEFEGLTSAVSSGSRIASDLEESESSFEPRLTVEYKPSDNQLFYALYSKGVKSGRWNTSTVAPALADGTRPPAGFVYAPPEELTNFEIGSKSTLMDGRMIVNAAIFAQDVKDQQLRQSVEIDEDLNGDGIPDVLNVIFTAGDSEIFGFELETVWRATEGLDLKAAVGYADHEFVDDITPSADFDLFDFTGGRSLKGKTSVNVPKVTGVFSANYSKTLNNGMNWTLRGDAIYTGKKYTELSNTAYIPSYTRLNLRTTLDTEAWTVSLFLNNALDDTTAVGAGLTGTSTCEFERNGPNLPEYNAAQRCIYLVPQRGRELGLNATFRF